MIFVTGGAGFIGSNFVHFLTEKTDEEIVIVDKMTYASDMANLIPLRFNIDGIDGDHEKHTLERVDLSDYDAVTELFKKYKPSSVFHFAAESHVDNSIKDVKPFVYTNVLGTTNLLQCSNDYQVEMFHHISTDEVYGSLGYNDLSFTEDTPYDPQNPYSASKASAEHFVNAYRETHKLQTIIVNSSNNY